MQRLRAENDPLDVALRAAIADMTPRLAASAKRLTELTPKSKDAVAATDAATVELASERQRHDTLDANLRAARAMQLQADDIATRIGARRRELFARQTFARSSSVFNPQLWLSVWREAPTDLRLMRALIGGWFASVGARLTLMQVLGMAGVIVLMALVSVPVLWIARRVAYRDPAEASPSRLRRAIAAVGTLFVLAVLPLVALWGPRSLSKRSTFPTPECKAFSTPFSTARASRSCSMRSVTACWPRMRKRGASSRSTIDPRR